MDKENIPKYNKIILSGGSTKGLATLGALQYLKDNNILDNINIFIGTSIGAILCYLICIGYTPIECMVQICTNQFVEKINANLDIVSFTNGTGIINYNIITEFLEKLTVEKIGRYITLGELKKKFGKELICTGYNFTQKKLEYFSPENNPDMPCITALRISSNIPLIFNRFKYMDCYYLDGGISNNFPINLIEKDDISLGIFLGSDREVEDVNEEFKLEKYIYKLLFIPISQNVKHQIKNYRHLCTDMIRIGIDGRGSSLNFDISNTQKLNIFSIGYQTVSNYYLNKKDDKNLEEKFREFGTQTDE